MVDPRVKSTDEKKTTTAETIIIVGCGATCKNEAHPHFSNKASNIITIDMNPSMKPALEGEFFRLCDSNPRLKSLQGMVDLIIFEYTPAFINDSMSEETSLNRLAKIDKLLKENGAVVLLANRVEDLMPALKHYHSVFEKSEFLFFCFYGQSGTRQQHSLVIDKGKHNIESFLSETITGNEKISAFSPIGNVIKIYFDTRKKDQNYNCTQLDLKQLEEAFAIGWPAFAAKINAMVKDIIHSKEAKQISSASPKEDQATQEAAFPRPK